MRMFKHANGVRGIRMLCSLFTWSNDFELPNNLLSLMIVYILSAICGGS